jgi:hypothetical protein
MDKMGMKTAVKATILIVLTGLVSACSAQDSLIVDKKEDPLIDEKNWVPKRMVSDISELEPGYYGAELTRLIFANGKEMKSDLVELQFIGQLAAPGRPPFNILSGRRCHSCDSNLSIYIHSHGTSLNTFADYGRLKKKAKRYRYPGNVYFFGDCLAGHSAGIVVWFVRSRLDRPNWAETVEVAEPTVGTFLEYSLDVSEIGSPVPPIDATLKLVEEERCREIPKRLMSTEH